MIATGVQADTGKHRSGAHRGGDGHRWNGHRGGGPRWNGHRWRGQWRGHNRWSPSWGVYFGLPLYWGAAWGWPYYYDDFYYPRDTVVYREVERMPEPYPEGAISPVPSTEVPRGEGAPTRGPLYMNYCESARAYFPKVTTCPEGWRLATPSS
jgi:hypothetical protein